MNRRVFLILLSLAVGSAMAAGARAVTIQPDEIASKDSFAYQFLPSLPTGNFNSRPFNAFLAAGATGTGHDTEAILEFDLSGIALSAAEVSSATLELFVVDTVATGFGISPSAGSPATVNLFGLTGSWDESTVAWNTLPGTGPQFASATVSGINQPVTFDVTALVKQWLDGTLTNNGLLLRGDAVIGSSPSFVIPAFSSSAGGVAPKLTIVPEPSGIVLALLAGAAVVWAARRRVVRRNHCS